jgi:hypothetical protein
MRDFSLLILVNPAAIIGFNDKLGSIWYHYQDSFRVVWRGQASRGPLVPLGVTRTFEGIFSPWDHKVGRQGSRVLFHP